MSQTAMVPLLDLKAQFKEIEPEIRRAIDSVLGSQIFIKGPEVEGFENEFAAYCGVKHAIGVSSGTDALLVSLMAADIKPGDEIITSTYTFFATAGAIARLGAVPIFVDIDPETYNIDVSAIESRITEKTKAIIPVHLFGQCCDMGPLLRLAQQYDVPVIEDAAQAVGALYKGSVAGTMGLAGCFSFFPSKNLGGYGDGGMVVTNDGDFAERVRILSVHGAVPKYYHSVVGGNFRLDAMQAAILRVKLKYLDAWNAQRIENALKYRSIFTDYGIPSSILSPPTVRTDKHIYHQFVIRTPFRDQLQEHLRRSNIGNQIYFPLPLHLQECFQNLGYREGDLTVSEKAALETLAIPIYSELSDAQIRHVVDKLCEALKIQTQTKA